MSLFISMPLALGLLGVFMLVLRVYQLRCRPHPEITRKLMHVGMGLFVLPFPWLFPQRWPVYLLAGIAAAALLATRLIPALKQGVGKVINSVERLSLGDVYFPISVGLLFYLFHNPLLYVIPMLILTLADAVAALIGITYGRLHYEAEEGRKSAEGSIAFFTVAFFSVHVPLLLLTDTGRAETLLIALMLGLVVMIIEAISWRGLDNLFIPLGGYAILLRYLNLSAHDLVIRLAVTCALVLFVMLFRRRSTLTHTALLGAALFGYGAYAFGGPVWLIPPLILFLCHAVYWPRGGANPSRHDVRAVIATAGPGLLLLVAYVKLNEPWLILPYTTLFAAHLAIIGCSWIPERISPVNRLWRLAGCLACGEALAAAMVMALHARALFAQDAPFPSLHPMSYLAWNALAIAMAMLLFIPLIEKFYDPETRAYHHVHRLGGAAAVIAALIILLLACFRITI